MSGHRPYSELRAKIEADPVRRARVATIQRAMEDATALARLLDDGRPASANGQDARSLVLAHEEDDYVSTLRAYVEDLGGNLELNAVFPDQTITLVATPEPTANDSSAADEPAEALAASG